MKNFAFLIHLGATLYLVGLIWIIQILHYPLMANVGADGYIEYQSLHMSRITPVVAPAMILELATGIYFAFANFEAIDRSYFWIGLALILVIWISTFLLQVPLHERLTHSFEGDTQKRLVQTNWIRTIVWTLRGALVLWMVWLKIK